MTNVLIRKQSGRFEKQRDGAEDHIQEELESHVNTSQGVPGPAKTPRR
jgi:hypothetical protein